MPIMRNPFRSKDENLRPATSGLDKVGNGSPTKPIDVEQKPPAEYQLSEINDSGVFIPPSPPEERKSFWTSSSSRSTTSSRNAFSEAEPFNISRESFDSYRRSFDISARSPVIFPETKPRSSLDSRTFYPQAVRQSSSFHRPLQVPGTQKEEVDDADAGAGGLEDIALDDPKPQPQKKRGMFSRMLDSESHSERPTSHGQKDGVSRSSWHHFGGRKRGQSGSGAELGDIPRREETPRPVESGLKNERRLSTPKTPITQAAQVVVVQTPQAPAVQATAAQTTQIAQVPAVQATAAQPAQTQSTQAGPGAEGQSREAPTVTVEGPS